MTEIRLKDLTLQSILELVKTRNPEQVAFHQAVYEVMESLVPFINENEKYRQTGLIERLLEPDRSILFRIPWEDNEGNFRVNRGFRVQFSSALGPYKGGLRFHPSVNLGIIKFLAFEQTFKNSLTGLPLGGGKGGSDFNPKGKSDAEIMRFCQSFVNELHRYVAHDSDVPAGDIGVGEREVGYMFGQYKRLTAKFTGVITGKARANGGSKVRTQSTGYGLLYFVNEMLKSRNETIEGKRIVISGSGNVAQFACEKAIEFGAKVVAMSDSNGSVYDKNGIDTEKLNFIKHLKNDRSGRIKEYAEKYKCEYKEMNPWYAECDIALPCATENEIGKNEAKKLVANNVLCVAEGANMPCTAEAVNIFQSAGIIYAPGKASNAGGVAVSGLEMTQNANRLSWSFNDVDEKLVMIMRRIHNKCVQYGSEGDKVNYMKGANIAGFIKVADAMISQGHV